MLSVIIPAYNEGQIIEKTANTLSEVLEKAEISYELIFVDDGSRDDTWENIVRVSQSGFRVRGVHFSRNFGKEAAMFAGLEQVSGDAAVVIDCDLQHPPTKIPEMYELWKEGYEVIEGVKSDRGEESGMHKAVSNAFYWFMSKATGCDMRNASDFKLLDRKVVDTLNHIPERNVFFRALSFWAGYKSTTVSYEVQERETGESKWSTRKLFVYAITNMLAFTSVPLHLVTGLGMLTLAISIVLGIVSLVQKIAGTAEPGFTTVILIILFIGSILMISLGIIGAYLEKIYDEVKGRPRYIVSETCGKENKNE